MRTLKSTNENWSVELMRFGMAIGSLHVSYTFLHMIRVWRKHNERMSVRGKFFDVLLKFVDSGLFGEHLDAKKLLKLTPGPDIRAL